MIFQVDLHSPKPIYQQLVDQLKQALASGRVKPGDRLPSIRDVAVDLRVNRNTVARVYEQLEREGLIYTRVGQGAFASDRGGDQLNRRTMRDDLLTRLDELIAQARVYKFTRAELEALVADRMAVYFPGDQPTNDSTRRTGR